MRCGCNQISNSPIEFPIDNVPINTILNLTLPSENSCDYLKLKQKIIKDYYCIIGKLECGHISDLEILLEEISLIDMKSGNFGITKKVYTSNKNYIEDDYLKHSNYLNEFDSEEEKNKALNNLGILDKLAHHIILSKEEYENLDEYEKDAIYFVTE